MHVRVEELAGSDHEALPARTRPTQHEPALLRCCVRLNIVRLYCAGICTTRGRLAERAYNAVTHGNLTRGIIKP